MSDLKLIELTKAYSGVVAVDRISLEIPEGEFVALLGPSGCGKTTTLRMISGFVPPSAGRVIVGDTDVTHLSPDRRNMGMVFQNYALFPHMTVRANIEFGLKCHRVQQAERRARIDEVLQLVGLSVAADRYPRQLSGGQQQRVALARVMALRPGLLLFDEPLSSLDAKLRIQMRGEIRRLQRQSGVTALYVTHDQEEAMTMADRIVVMSNGVVEQVGTPAEIYDRPRTRFIAAFIGSANFFEGSLDGGGGRWFRCRSGLALPLDGAAAPDAGVLAIRPERIEFVPATTEGALPGVITQAMQIGALMEYTIELRSGDRVTVQAQRRSGAAGYREGEDVAIAWPASDSILLPS
jgi:putative spermidine/putrescine transport system ATP-binding protein